MSAVAKLLAQKEELLARLEAGPGPNESVEIQALPAKIETALKLLGEPGSAAVGRKYRRTVTEAWSQRFW